MPANNDGNGHAWQWGNELLVGFTEADFSTWGHQVNDDKGNLSRLARASMAAKPSITNHENERGQISPPNLIRQIHPIPMVWRIGDNRPNKHSAIWFR